MRIWVYLSQLTRLFTKQIRFLIIKKSFNWKMRKEFTSRRSILRQSWTSRIVPFKFISTALLSTSSNLTVAAEWKTMETFSASILVSADEMPNSANDMSPPMATSLFSTSGLSFLRASKTFVRKFWHFKPMCFNSSTTQPVMNVFVIHECIKSTTNVEY